ncbi:SdrD B-like domain-containing protein [Chloroflexota bacterium]
MRRCPHGFLFPLARLPNYTAWPCPSGVAGVTVELWIDSDGNSTPDTLYDTTTTGTNGDYSFDNTPPGDYIIIETDPTGYTSTNDVSAPNDNWVPVTRVGSTPSTENDFLDSDSPNLGSIGDTIFYDKNQDGSPDAGEGIAGVIVWIDYDSDGPIDANEPQAITDASGNYTLSDLPAGTHPVKVDTSTLPDGLTDNSVDLDGGFDSQAKVMLAPSEDNTTTNFGYLGTGSIGDTFYNDQDGSSSPVLGEGIESSLSTRTVMTSVTLASCMSPRT